jgi:hypothetical protein
LDLDRRTGGYGPITIAAAFAIIAGLNPLADGQTSDPDNRESLHASKSRDASP